MKEKLSAHDQQMLFRDGLSYSEYKYNMALETYERAKWALYQAEQDLEEARTNLVSDRIQQTINKDLERRGLPIPEPPRLGRKE